MMGRYEDQIIVSIAGPRGRPSPAHPFKQQGHACNATRNIRHMSRERQTLKAHRIPHLMHNSKQREPLHIGIMPIPPTPWPPRNPPRLVCPPPKLLPLFLLLVELRFVTPVEVSPLLVPPEAFLFRLDPPREFPRPLLPPRVKLSLDCARTGGIAGAS